MCIRDRFRAVWEEDHKLPASPETPEELTVLLRESVPDYHMGHYTSAGAALYKLREGMKEMRIRECEYAPQVESYVDMLKNICGRWDNPFSYDDETYALLDELFEELTQIKPEDSHGRKLWNLWLKADRGPIDAYGDYAEMKEYEEVRSYEEYEDCLLYTSPSPRD